MFEKKCTLCGGTLNQKDICTECGLDNKKSEKKETNCRYQKSSRQTGNQKRENKSGFSKTIGILAVIISLAGIFINIAEDYGSEIKNRAEEIFNTGKHDTDYEYDPYIYVEKELPKTGEEAEYVLSSGHYIVGVNIPEGNYKVIPGNTYDAVDIEDPVNSIYLYKYADEGEDIIEDIRLYKGALFTVFAKEQLSIRSSNAQKSDMSGIDNPLTETVVLNKKERKTAGTDFPAGIYDLNWLDGSGNFTAVIYGENGEELTQNSIGMYKGGRDGFSYHYFVLPEGTTITCDTDLSISMIPSSKIESTDYLSFYTRFK